MIKNGDTIKKILKVKFNKKIPNRINAKFLFGVIIKSINYVLDMDTTIKKNLHQISKTGHKSLVYDQKNNKLSNNLSDGNLKIYLNKY